MPTTPPPTGGELNPTQQLYAKTLGRERMDMLEHHVGRRAYTEPEFKARVELATQSLTGSWPRGLVRASREVIGHVLHMDDVMTGRWQAPQQETDPLARIASGAGFRNGEIYEVSLVTHIKGPNCIDPDDDHPVCTGCGIGFITSVEPVDG